MRKIIVAVAIVLAGAGCGNDGGVRPAESGEAKPPPTTSAASATEQAPAASTSGGSWADAVAFVEAIDKGDYDKARGFVGAGTWAEKYVIHQEAADKAFVAAGLGGVEPGLSVTGDE